MQPSYDQTIISQYKSDKEIDNLLLKNGQFPYRTFELPVIMDLGNTNELQTKLIEHRQIARNAGATKNVDLNNVYCFHVTSYLPIEGVIYPRQNNKKIGDAPDLTAAMVQKNIEEKVETLLSSDSLCMSTINPKLASMLELTSLSMGLSKEAAQFIAKIYGINALNSDCHEYIQDRSGMCVINLNYITQLVSTARSTVHFTLNHLVTAHDGHSGWPDDSYVVVANLNDIKEQLVAGYIEDMFSIGPVHLKGDITLFVNQAKYNQNPDIQMEVNSLPSNIKVKFYTGKYKDAVSNWAESTGIQLLETKEYLKSSASSEVMVVSHSNKKYLFDSLVINKSLGIPYMEHKLTPMSTLEGIFISRNIISDSPFLNFLYEYKKCAPQRDIKDEIKVLIELIRKYYRIPVCNRDAFKMYCRAIYKAADAFMSSPTQGAFNRFVEPNEQFFKYFDHLPDFAREVKGQSLCGYMSEYTGLKFQCFYQTSGKTLVDIVFKDTSFNGKALEILATKLSSVFNVQFFLQEQEGQSYIVTKHVNKKENGAKIYQSIDWSKKEEVQQSIAF